MTQRSRLGSRAPVVAAGARVRAVIDALLPAIDGGRFAVKCIAGEAFVVEAHCFTDGHDALRVVLQWRAEGAALAEEVAMVHEGNDVWRASFTPPVPGRYGYTVSAWVDALASWQRELERRVDAEDVRLAALVGADLLDGAATRAAGADREALQIAASGLRKAAGGQRAVRAVAKSAARRGAGTAPAVGSQAPAASTALLRAQALDAGLLNLAARYPERSLAAQHAVELPLVADRARARCSAWYELFPRSTHPEPGRHGRFADVEALLPYIAEMGFDVLYLPPIHPIGREKRKGKNNALLAEPGDVGSPWAIGAAEGGHKSLLPELGSAADFRRLVQAAATHGMELALDIAFQCAPDHPYVTEHPDWFRWRPDGSVQYAENPPKKYQDIYPFNFECDDWAALWGELQSVFEHWVGEGVRIFRVDNPHTKSFAFWEWVIREIKREHPDVLFLAEAFTRPKPMHRLAKLGFSQSYTYFTWRNTRRELVDYFTELAHGPGKDCFRPNVWPNTPDILSEHLHHGGREIFALRLLLAATLSANYGIYGPAFELMENQPREPGSEEYLDSEKYQLRRWSLERADSLAPFIARLNRIRREQPALQSNHRLAFLPTDNDALLAYAKRGADGGEPVLVVANLDTVNTQSGWLELDLGALGLVEQASEAGGPAVLQAHDLLSGERFAWQGRRHFIRLDPQRAPAHVFVLRQALRREHDFDYFA